MISVTIIGIDQVISNFKRMSDGLPRASSDAVNDIADSLVVEMQRNAHVVTGAMKNSIHKEFAGEGAANVVVGVPYAAYENRRPGSKMGFGPHNFADKAMQTVRSQVDAKVGLHFKEFFG